MQASAPVASTAATTTSLVVDAVGVGSFAMIVNTHLRTGWQLPGSLFFLVRRQESFFRRLCGLASGG
jgi:uncharacterized membrane protein